MTGTKIGGSTAFFTQFAGAVEGTEKFVAYRADITSRNLVAAGANTLTISNMSFASNFPTGFPFNQGNDGAGVVVIYDLGSDSTVIGLRDGLDMAFKSFASPLDTTVAQTFTFASSAADRNASISALVGSVSGPDMGGLRGTVMRVSFSTGATFDIVNPWQSLQGPEFDAWTQGITIPAGATSMTVQALSAGGDRPASFAWIAASLTITTPPPPKPAVFLVIDEDGIDNGDRYWLNSATSFTPPTIQSWSTNDVNDDRPGFAQRLQLRFFENNVGNTFWLWTGQVGDEGWFAPKVIPPSWATAGPTSDGLRNFLGNPTAPHNVGPGLGTGSNPEALLDKTPFVAPLRAEGLHALIGRSVCALVWDSNISINYVPLNGSLKGEKLGVVAFDVHDVVFLPGFSSSTLPRVQVTIRDANEVCGGSLNLFNDAPEPSGSSTPMDIRPGVASDNAGYTFVTR